MKNKSLNLLVLSTALLMVNSSSYGYSNSFTYDNDWPMGNPSTQGCTGDAITLTSKTIFSQWNSAVGKIEIRYSAVCKSTWTRVTNYLGDGDNDISVTDADSSIRTDSFTATHTWNQYPDDIFWSPMATAQPGSSITAWGGIKIWRSLNYHPWLDDSWYTAIAVGVVPESNKFSLENNGYAVNAHTLSNYANVNMWSHSSSDTDQQWIWLGDNLQRVNSNYCLNAYSHMNGGNISLWQCNSNDSDQLWSKAWESDGTANIALGSTGYCLNAYNRSNGSNLNLWACSPNDPDQRFKVISSQ